MNFVTKYFYELNYDKRVTKLDISKDFYFYLVSTSDNKSSKDILDIINKSSSNSDFKKRIIDYLNEHPKSEYLKCLLNGMITENYKFIPDNYVDIEMQNEKNFKNFDQGSITNKLLLTNITAIINNIIENNNYYRHIFKAFTKEKNSNSLIEEYIFSKDLPDEFNIEPFRYIQHLFYRIVNEYRTEEILSNPKFVIYDFLHNNDNLDYEKRLELYNSTKDIDEEDKSLIINLKILKEKIKKLDELNRKYLEDQLSEIKEDMPNKLENIKRIYEDYESLYRYEIMNYIYSPNQDITYVSEYEDMENQLLCIINYSTINYRTKFIEYIKDVSLDNFFKSKDLIKGSIYRKDFFLNNPYILIGVGISKEKGQILLSGKNIEMSEDGEIISQNKQLSHSIPLTEILEHSSSNIIFKKDDIGYIFISIIGDKEINEEFINIAKSYAEKYNLKLVIYDISGLKKTIIGQKKLRKRFYD